MDSERLLIGKRDAAFLLGVSLRTIENLIARKELIPRKVGRRVLIPRRDLERFVRRDHATQPAGDDSPVIA